MNVRGIAEQARADPGLARRLGQLAAAALGGDLEPPADGADLALRASELGGLGVFATRGYAEGETVEVCPYVEVTAAAVAGTALADRVFAGADEETVLVIFGFAKTYNHADRPNLRYEHLDEGRVRFLALTDVAAGSELTIDYGSSWWRTRGRSPVRLQPRRAPCEDGGVDRTEEEAER